MRTSITSIAIYMNDPQWDLRGTEITQQDFKVIVENHRKAKTTAENNDGKTKTTRSSKQPAAGSSTAATATVKDASKALQFIEDLGTTAKEFADQCDKVVALMSSNHKEYSNRTDERFHIRLIASGGLLWNDRSKNRSRDYMLAATAAVLESHFVPLYRELMIEKSGGAKQLRKELSDYLFSIAKSNFVTVKNSEGEEEVQTVTEWKFADLLEVEGPFPTLNFDGHTHQVTLEKSTKSAREDAEVERAVNKLVTCELLECFDQGAGKGKLETTAYYAIKLLKNVGGMSSCFNHFFTTADAHVFCCRSCFSRRLTTSTSGVVATQACSILVKCRFQMTSISNMRTRWA
jgi:hypothetical protein